MVGMDSNIRITILESPCKDCKKRFLGCHDSKKCKKWAVYVLAKKAAAEKRRAYYQEQADIEMSMARHGKRSTKKKEK